MKTKYSIIPFLLALKIVHGGILLWGSREIQIPALQAFNSDDLHDLLNESNNVKVVAFKCDRSKISPYIRKLLVNKYSVYISYARMNVENFTELTGDGKEDYRIISEALEEAEREFGTNNTIALIIESDNRFKREAQQFSSTFSTETVTPKISYSEIPDGPILYSAKDKDLNEAMVFSTKPPLLKTNTSSLLLGKSTIAQLDSRGSGSYSRLIVTIPVEDGKITLRFKFPWENGYWYLTSVEVLDTDSKSYNLSITKDITAPRHFSYHCGGEVVFVDAENYMKLYLSDVQVQPDAYDHRFSDAYNCVPFTTAPIWSGLFVTFILMIGLAVGLAALGSIKTMDKFDNHKTKQLSITVSE